nr:hypothetical protein [Lachnospiraceae bacterium]
CKKKRVFRNGKEEIIPHDFVESGIVPYEISCIHPFISTADLFVTAELCKNTYFDPLVERQQDYDWGIRAVKNHRAWFENKIMTISYEQSDSISLKGIETIISQREYFIKKYADLCKEYPHFHMYQIEAIRVEKARRGMDYTEEYRRMYEISKSPEYFLRYFLSKMGVTRCVNHFRNMKGSDKNPKQMTKAEERSNRKKV